MDFFRSILSDDPEPESDPNQTQQTDDVIPPESDTGGAWSFGDLVKTLTTKSESVFETYKRDLKEFGTELRKESDLFRDVAIRAVNELPEAGTSALDSVLKRDERTYVEEVDDVEDFEKWKMGFVVGEKKEEIEKLVGENGVLAGIYEKLVLNGNVVDDGTFWFRYFYKVYRMEVQEEMRAKLVKRSLSSFDDEEDLSWDVDDDEEVKAVESEDVGNVDDNVVNVEEQKTGDENVLVVEKDEKVDVDVESSEVKDSSNVVEKTNEEEDLEWDEIEDLGENDDKKNLDLHSIAWENDEKKVNGLKQFDCCCRRVGLMLDFEDNDDVEHLKSGNR
ncbi:BSD-like protein [Artemisia annua]|uniref:BSD-like protein n=1 Tax=Artemisia annua TaxID=35608 RepID=A0A2U1MDC3_ARTAN|nr:BSD-like protein [Artemisia annua]